MTTKPNARPSIAEAIDDTHRAFFGSSTSTTTGHNWQGRAYDIPHSEPEEDSDRSALIKMLDARRIKFEDKPEKPLSVLRLVDQDISTPGNLTAVYAQAKAGKTAALGGMLAAIVAATLKNGDADAPWDKVDSLGWEAAPMGGKAVIMFDTEQSPFDAWRNLEKVARRARIEAFPPQFRAYRLLDVATPQRRLLLRLEMSRAAAECGGVHLVVVDGVADLITSVNDEIGAVELVDELVRLAVDFGCPIVLVIHENSGSQTDKMRGHLGSQIERKAESNLRLIKGSDGVTEVFALRCRSAHIPQGQGVFFEWSDDAKMHVRVEREPVDKKGARMAADIEVRDAVFVGVLGALTYSELKERIMRTAGVKDRAAEGRISKWLKGPPPLLAKDDGGRYRKAP